MSTTLYVDGSAVKEGLSILERISNTDPVLALLLLLLFAIIFILTREYLKVRRSKEAEVKELNNILLQVREADKEMLVDLKNLIARFMEIEKDQSVTIKSNTDRIERHSDLLTQFLTKLDVVLNQKS